MVLSPKTGDRSVVKFIWKPNPEVTQYLEAEKDAAEMTTAQIRRRAELWEIVLSCQRAGVPVPPEVMAEYLPLEKIRQRSQETFSAWVNHVGSKAVKTIAK